MGRHTPGGKLIHTNHSITYPAGLMNDKPRKEKLQKPKQETEAISSIRKKYLHRLVERDVEKYKRGK